VRVGIYGFGAIGRLLALTAIERGHEVIGAVDVREDLIGKDVGSVLGVGNLGVTISNNVDLLADADVVLHATGSLLDRVYDQLVSIIRLGLPIVSTCETLSYPYYRYPVLARELDRLAKDYGSIIIGTGVNPGYIWDALVVMFGAVVPTIKKITAIRSFDLGKRREPLRKKVGLGLKPEEFSKALSEGKLTAHVGYAESIYLICTAAGVQPTKVIEIQEPVIAQNRVESSGVTVEAGTVAGVKGFGIGYLGNEEFIRLEFSAYVGAPEYDEITIEGKDHTIKWRCTGIQGDKATASVILSVAEKIYWLAPGLHLITELVPFKIRIPER
jgi:4-hydroxy-tetrahydrodipicolinate reductase